MHVPCLFLVAALLLAGATCPASAAPDPRAAFCQVQDAFAKASKVKSGKSACTSASVANYCASLVGACGSAMKAGLSASSASGGGGSTVPFDGGNPNPWDTTNVTEALDELRALVEELKAEHAKELAAVYAALQQSMADMAALLAKVANCCGGGGGGSPPPLPSPSPPPDFGKPLYIRATSPSTATPAPATTTSGGGASLPIGVLPPIDARCVTTGLLPDHEVALSAPGTLCLLKPLPLPPMMFPVVPRPMYYIYALGLGGLMTGGVMTSLAPLAPLWLNDTNAGEPLPDANGNMPVNWPPLAQGGPVVADPSAPPFPWVLEASADGVVVFSVPASAIPANALSGIKIYMVWQGNQVLWKTVVPTDPAPNTGTLPDPNVPFEAHWALDSPLNSKCAGPILAKP